MTAYLHWRNVTLVVYKVGMYIYASTDTLQVDQAHQAHGTYDHKDIGPVPLMEGHLENGLRLQQNFWVGDGISFLPGCNNPMDYGNPKASFPTPSSTLITVRQLKALWIPCYKRVHQQKI